MRPLVVDHVGLAGGQRAERGHGRVVAQALALPAGLRRDRALPLLRVRGPLAPPEHRARRPLEHEELPGVLRQARHHLDGGRARPDDPDPLAPELAERGERLVRRAPRRGVVPPRRVQHLALEPGEPDPAQLRHLRPREQARRQRRELRVDLEGAPLRAAGAARLGELGRPGVLGVVPDEPLERRAEQDLVLEAVLLDDSVQVGADLGARRVPVGRHGPQLLEQRQVDVGFDVAVQARVPVPVPGAADAAGRLDDADRVGGEPGLHEAGREYHTAHPRPRDQEFDLVAVLERWRLRVQRRVIRPHVVDEVSQPVCAALL